MVDQMKFYWWVGASQVRDVSLVVAKVVVANQSFK